MTKQSKLGAIIAITALFAGQCAANAATVYPEKGRVLVNDGHGFMRIDGETPVMPGAKVMANPDGSAVISYSADCVVHVNPGEVKTVLESVPCDAHDVSYKDHGDDGPGNTTFLIAGGAAAAAVGVAIAVSQDKPASP